MNIYGMMAIKNKSDIRNLTSKTAVTLSHTFADNAARDTYFVANPTKLIERQFIKVGTGYQQYINSVWEASTAVVADLSAIKSQLDYYATEINNLNDTIEPIETEYNKQIISWSQKETIINLFENLNEVVVGSGVTAVLDTVTYKYGTAGIKMTSGTNSARVDIIKNLDLKDKSIILDVYVHDTNMQNLQILLYINNSYWINYLFGIKIPNDLLNVGYQRVIINANLFDNIQDINHLKSVSKIRIVGLYKNVEIPTSVTLDRLAVINNPFKKGIVTITFDDGETTDFTVAKPIMDKYGYAGVSYIATDNVGATNKMTLDQLTKAYECGWDISSHTKSHFYFEETTPVETIEDELIGSYDWLVENGFAKSAKHLAYPGGRGLRNVRKVAQRVYKTGRTTDDGLITFPRHHLSISKVTGASTEMQTMKNAVDNAVATKSWVVFMFHSVNDLGTGTSPIKTSEFSELMQYISASGAEVRTMSEMLLG